MKFFPVSRWTCFLILYTGITALCCSCQKPKSDPDTAVGNDYSLMETESNQVMDAVQSSMIDHGLGRLCNQGSRSTLLPACATVTLNTGQQVLTIDFGNVNCLCSDWDGKNRKGKLVAAYSGNYGDSGTTIHLTTEDYYVNDNHFNYDLSLTNMGHNGQGQPYFKVVISNASAETPTGTISWSSLRTRTWSEGYNSATPYDDVYEIAGTASGTSRSGTTFNAEILTSLVKEVGCRWITKGTLQITPSGQDLRTLDFGDGTCDSKAVLVVNGVTYNINLD